MQLSRSVALAALAGTLSVASAGPPAFVQTGQVGGDLSADGLTVAGTIFDIAQEKHIIYTYTPGVGAVRTEAIVDNDPIRCSADGTRVSFNAYDLENVSGLGTDRFSMHLWDLNAGTFNIGGPPGGQSCDAFTFTASDISGNGRYIVGSGYTVASCGPYRAARLDTQTSTWEELPFSISAPPLNAPASLTRADAVNADGTVICGFDENYEPSVSLTQRWRGASAWVKSGGVWTQTVLDRLGGRATAVSADGSTIVGRLSDYTPVRWTRSGTTWTVHSLSADTDLLPIAVSADGSTIVGSGGSDSGFIWRASLNGGVPMSIADHVTSLGGTIPAGYSIAAFIGSPVRAISDDGNALLVAMTDERNQCLLWSPSAILYLNGAPCEPARVIFNPVPHYNPAGPLDEPYGMILNCFAAGTAALDFQWQRETEVGSGDWTDLADDNCEEYLPEYFDFRGTTTMQLRIGGLSDDWAGRYRCIVSNACGSETSYPVRVATCFADFDCNGFVNGDDFDSFVAFFELGDQVADADGNTFVNGDDFDVYVVAFEAGC